ncbi:MAG: DUF4012 domain-containing protein [Actinomycetota bacterium]|nr:DUF4012 domain-containing protein [Actinomycetota bacterium]
MTATVHQLASARRDHGRFPRTPRRRRLFALVVVGGWVVFCSLQLALSYRDARGGMHETLSARRDMSSEGVAADRADVRLDRARRLFHEAHRRSASPVLAPLRALPVVRRQLRSFADLTAAASRVAGVAATSAEAVHTLLRESVPTGTGRPAALRLLGDHSLNAEAALGGVDLGDPDGLVGPLRRRWAALAHDVASARATLRTAAEGLHGVANVLEGPRRYLLLAANNAEMRAGSGMFLSIGTIETAGGSVRVGPLRPSGDLTLPGEGVHVDGDLAARWDWLNPGREWRNLATTPRFDVTAPLAVGMWETLTGEKLDGALALDVPFLAAILDATGPVAVGDGVIDGSTVVGRLLRDQYHGLDVKDPQAERREELGAMAAAVVGALERGDYSPWRLATALARASRGRHVLAWSVRPEDQRTWDRAGIAGLLEPDSLAVSILNRGGNKLDPFLTVEAGLGLHPSPNGTEVTLRLKMANEAPTGLSPYVAGPHPRSGIGEGDYLGIIAVNVPGAATDIAVEGARPLSSSGPDGPTQVVAAPLLLTRGQETTVTVQFRLPLTEQSMRVVPSARVPAVPWESGPHRWHDDRAKVVSWRWD